MSWQMAVFILYGAAFVMIFHIVQFLAITGIVVPVDLNMIYLFREDTFFLWYSKQNNVNYVW